MTSVHGYIQSYDYRHKYEYPLSAFKDLCKEPEKDTLEYFLINNDNFSTYYKIYSKVNPKFINCTMFIPSNEYIDENILNQDIHTLRTVLTYNTIDRVLDRFALRSNQRYKIQAKDDTYIFVENEKDNIILNRDVTLLDEMIFNNGITVHTTTGLLIPTYL